MNHGDVVFALGHQRRKPFRRCWNVFGGAVLCFCWGYYCKPPKKYMYIQYIHIYIYIHRYIISNIVISKDPSVLLVPSPVQDQHGKDHARLSLSHVQLHNGPRILNELLRYLQAKKGMVSPESAFKTKTSSNEDTSRFKMVVERNPAISWYCKDLSQLVHDLFHQQWTVSNNTRLFSRATQGSSFYQKACDIMVEKWHTSCL